MSLCPYHLGGIWRALVVPSCPCLLLVTALSAARADPESHSGSAVQEVAWNLALGGRLGITCRKAVVIELIAAAEWLCLIQHSKTLASCTGKQWWPATLPFTLLSPSNPGWKSSFGTKSNMGACTSCLQLWWQPYPADTKSVRRGLSDEGSSCRCAGREAAF